MRRRGGARGCDQLGTLLKRPGGRADAENMRQRARENVVPGALACAGVLAVSWLGLYGYGWNDYEVEAKPAFDALTHGHVLEFLRLAPAYGGSLVERAPFALLPGLWGGGALAVYRAVSIPCLVAAAALGVWLAAEMRASVRSSRLGRGLVVALCTASPLTLRALEVGHAEELLMAAMCMTAVIAAARGHTVLAGVLLGLAIAGKDWAVVAIGPVLLALPAYALPRTDPAQRPGGRFRAAALCMLAAAGTAAAVLAPLLIVAGQHFVTATRGVASTSSAIFQPWQIWWFAGRHGPVVHGLFGAVKQGYRTAPAWIGPLSHPAVVIAAAVLAAGLWRARRSAGQVEPGRARAREQQAMLLLALVLLLRCLLDTWDTSYYMLPFLLALTAWEALGALERPPALALFAGLLGWASFVWLPDIGSADAQAAFFLAWTLPLAGALGLRLFAPRRAASWWTALGSRLRLSLHAAGSYRGDAAGGPAGISR
jgi:hypothetical protein